MRGWRGQFRSRFNRFEPSQQACRASDYTTLSRSWLLYLVLTLSLNVCGGQYPYPTHHVHLSLRTGSSRRTSHTHGTALGYVGGESTLLSLTRKKVATAPLAADGHFSFGLPTDVPTASLAEARLLNFM